MTIKITPQIIDAYEAYLSEQVDADLHGRTILRRHTAPFSTGLHIGIVDFAAGFQAAQSCLIGLPVIAPDLLDTSKEAGK